MNNDTLITQNIGVKITKKAKDIILNCDVRRIELDNILNGKLSLANYFRICYNQEKNEKYLTQIEKILEDVFRKIDEEKSFLASNLTLADGLSGLGITLFYLLKEGIIDEEFQEQVNIINELVAEKCLQMIDKNQFDYFHGAIGLLYYLNEVNQTEDCLKIVDILYEYGKKNDYLFYNNTNDPYTEGINFGVAHGSLAIVAVLFQMHQKGIALEKTKELILGTMNSLIQFKKGTVDDSLVNIMHDGFDYPSFFPYNIINGTDNFEINPNSNSNLFHYTDRLGWCNSDLSHVLILYKLGTFFKNDTYIQIADDIGFQIVNRKEFKDTSIANSYMCHGSAGVAMIYKKIIEFSDNKLYKEAYEYWINMTCDYFEKEVNGNYSIQDFELLTGWLGAIYVIDSDNGGDFKNWDSVFLV
jgi:lantibiotic biosynthesis protein